MSIINLLKNDVWNEWDIVDAGRTNIASQVSVARQDELRTIMLGHIAGMRAATDEEMAEIMLVKTITEAQVELNAQARADMALLQSALDYEAAQARLLLPTVTEPLTVSATDMEGVPTEIPSPAIAQDAAERVAAQALIDGATQATLALVLLRNPPPAVELVSEPVVEAPLPL